MSEQEGVGPFAVKDCALIGIASGKRAETLKELRDILLTIEPSTIYHHFWGGLLSPRIEEREYNNDFASWVRHGLHDGRLAEKLAMVDPTRCTSLEELRQDVVEIIEDRLDESEFLPWIRATHQFQFMRSQIVVFDATRQAQTPMELAELLPHLSASSVFYHFIDARRRTPDAGDDFSTWLAGLGKRYDELRDELMGVDPYFVSLVELRQQLTKIFERHLGAGP